LLRLAWIIHEAAEGGVMAVVSFADIIPGGVQAADHWHRRTDDGTCSRCRREVPDQDVPLRVWSPNGQDMLTYCERCLDGLPPLDA
jgi:hypothetical protein